MHNNSKPQQISKITIVQTDDFPAAHSMDSVWFAVDEAGEVALMQTSEVGTVPHNIQLHDSAYDLFENLEKDEFGWPIYPLHYDPFANGNDNDVLIQAFAALSEAQKAELLALAAIPQLSPSDRKKLAICAKANTEFSSVIVLLAEPKDSLAFHGDIISDDQIGVRLAPDSAIYLVQCSDDLIDCVRLWLRGRLISLRIFYGMLDYENDLATTLGFYTYDVDEDFLLQPKICPPIYWPKDYQRVGTPEVAQKSIPKLLLAGFRKKKSKNELVESFPSQFLPGVRFAEMDKIQLATIIPCYEWHQKEYDPKQSKILIQRNMKIAQQEDGKARQIYKTQWLAEAEKGDFIAQYSLGYLYCETWEKDLTKAAYWFEIAANHADANHIESDDMYENGSVAQYCFAELLYQSLLVEDQASPEKISRMLSWLHKAAARKQPNALYRLGDLHARGQFVAQDLLQANQWLNQATRLNHYEASKLLESLAKTKAV